MRRACGITCISSETKLLVESSVLQGYKGLRLVGEVE